MFYLKKKKLHLRWKLQSGSICVLYQSLKSKQTIVLSDMCKI